MKKDVFHIKIYSIIRFLIAIPITYIPILILEDDYFPQFLDEWPYLFFITLFGISCFVDHLLARAKVKIILDEEGFHHIWEKRFILSWEKNHIIPWANIESYYFQEDRTFDSYLIDLKDKRQYKINRFNLIPIEDDFKKLVKEFPKLSNRYRKENKEKTVKIVEGQSMYDSKTFKWLFYILSLLFVFSLISKLFNPESEIRWISLAIIGSPLCFYFAMRNRKKSK